VTRLSEPQLGQVCLAMTLPGFFWAVFAFFSAMMRLSSLRCDQLSLGTTELLAGFNGRLLSGNE
jgi:hypothetical protein